MVLFRSIEGLRTQTRSNRQVIADAYQAIFDREPERAQAAFDDDSVWVQPGGNALSGEYRGPAEIVAHTTNAWKMTDGTLCTEVLELLGGDQFVVAIERTFGRRNGVSLNMVTNTVFEMTGGIVTTMRVLPSDTGAWNAFWA